MTFTHHNPPPVPRPPRMRHRRRTLAVHSSRLRRPVVVLIAAIAVAALVILYIYNPENTVWMPHCPSHMLTGYDCPGCGTLRALHSLMHGDIAAAWHYNAALFFAIPMVAVLAVASHTRPHSPLRRFADSRWTPISVFIALIVWTVWRNI